jgi:hypothetical protein
MLNILFAVKVGGSAIGIFKYRLLDGSMLDKGLFCQDNLHFKQENI